MITWVCVLCCRYLCYISHFQIACSLTVDSPSKMQKVSSCQRRFELRTYKHRYQRTYTHVYISRLIGTYKQTDILLNYPPTYVRTY